MIRVEDLEEGATLTVGAYLGSWLDLVRTRVRPSTFDGYEFLVRNHAIPALGEILLPRLHPLHIQGLYQAMLQPGYRSGRSLSAKTVGNLHRVLRQALAQALSWRLVEWNAAAAAQPPRSRPSELAVVDMDLAHGILAASEGTRFEAPVAIAIATGMRRARSWASVGQTWTRSSPWPGYPGASR